MFNGKIFGQPIIKKFTPASAKSVIGSESLKQSPNKSSIMNYCVRIGFSECVKYPVKFTLKDFISNHYFDNQLGFFCKKELQLDKITTVPVRFRLGSLEYVNYMEQKPNAIKPR
jgi:hypothetical protein